VPTPSRHELKAGSQRGFLRRHRILVAVLAVVIVFLGWLGVSLGSALTNPSYGVSLSARFAEWGRQHGIGGVVTWAENEWYLHHPPPKGGKPPKGAFKVKTNHAIGASSSCPHALAAPATIVSPASPTQAGEGVWQPVGRLSAGCSGLYQTFVRPDNVHTSYVVGMVWMDPKLVSATLYSGNQIPGGGPYANSAPISATAASTLVSAFNAGFRTQDAQGGYYTDGKTIIPLVDGKASAVIYKDGTMNIAAWNQEVSMTPDVVSVRQNLDLIVDGSQPAPGLNVSDNIKWGATLGGAAFVWRSGLGITADGALVYVGGPGLSITALADLFVRAGCLQAMELDINTDWVQYSIYSPAPGQLASPSNGAPLLVGMAGGAQGPDRYFESYWTRDFFTMSARYPADGTMPTSSTTTTATKK
jgi:uncharacterized protein YigE (DUF2233 family)